MENVNDVLGRVQKYLPARLARWGKFVQSLCNDPRSSRGTRHTLAHCVLALLCGVMSNRSSLREVERLSQRMGLGSRGRGVSDGALSHLLGLSHPDDFEPMLVASVRDADRRGELRHPDFSEPWAAIDGKYSTLDHHCGGWGQKFFTADASDVYWRVGVLRAVLITSPGRVALGQFPMGPVQTTDTDPEKIKHTGEITNLPPFIAKLRQQYGDLVRNFTLDAGLWSKALYLAMDVSGFGLLCGLKENKPELHAEVARQLRIDMAKFAPQAESDWESSSRGKVRRRLWRTTKLDGWLGWHNLRQAIVVEQTTRDSDGKETVELRYFVTNATTGNLSPLQLLRLIRLHWAIENDCNWSFDMQFGEDDRRWCTENMALLTLGVLRMVAYNTQQHLRKCHVVVHHQRAVDSPRPWRETAELVLDCFKGLPKAFVATLGSVTLGNLRRAAASPSG